MPVNEGATIQNAHLVKYSTSEQRLEAQSPSSVLSMYKIEKTQESALKPQASLECDS